MRGSNHEPYFMYILFLLLLLASLVLLVIGLISPQTSLFWYRRTRTRRGSFLFYLLLAFISLIICAITVPDVKTTEQEKKNAERYLRNVEQSDLSQRQKDSIAQVEKQTEIAERKKITFTAGDLIAAYEKNEVAADQNFKGQSFYITGYVDHVGKDILNDSYLTFKAGNDFRGVQCYVEDQDVLAQLKPGQRITVYGECDGLSMNVQIKNAKIVENLP